MPARANSHSEMDGGVGRLVVAEVSTLLASAGFDGWSGELPANLGSPGTQVYVLDDVVLKVVDDPTSPRMRRERDALVHLACECCDRVAVPRLIASGVTVDSREWVLMSRVRGVAPADAAQPAHEVSASLAAQLGRAAAGLHGGCAPPGFGTWARDPRITLVDEHRQRRRSVMGRARQLQLIPDAELSVLERLLDATEPSLRSAPSRPVLAHRDLQPRNVLVDDAGVLVGLVDFEAAGGGDPAEDFSRVGLDWGSTGFRAFCVAYRQFGGALGEDAAERVTFHTLYWAALIVGHVAVPFPEYLEPARRAIVRVADGDRPQL